MSEVHLVIPMEPPNVNNYKGIRVVGKHVRWYLRPAAKAWYSAVDLAVDSLAEVPMETVSAVENAKAHAVEYTVYQGLRSRGDVDNYAKVILDGLVKSGVLKTDASVVDLICHKRRDRETPRTVITVREAI